VVAGATTWSGSAGGPTSGMTGPQAAHGPRAPLGPTCEENRAVRRAIHGGRDRRKTGECSGDLLERRAGR
jgi:hypothetical protein